MNPLYKKLKSYVTSFLPATKKSCEIIDNNVWNLSALPQELREEIYRKVRHQIDHYHFIPNYAPRNPSAVFGARRPLLSWKDKIIVKAYSLLGLPVDQALNLLREWTDRPSWQSTRPLDTIPESEFLAACHKDVLLKVYSSFSADARKSMSGTINELLLSSYDSYLLQTQQVMNTIITENHLPLRGQVTLENLARYNEILQAGNQEAMYAFVRSFNSSIPGLPEFLQILHDATETRCPQLLEKHLIFSVEGWNNLATLYMESLEQGKLACELLGVEHVQQLPTLEQKVSTISDLYSAVVTQWGPEGVTLVNQSLALAELTF